MGDISVPDSVAHAAGRIGTYLGVDIKCFSIDGTECNGFDDPTFIVVGNYYGSAILLLTKEGVKQVVIE